MKKTKAVQRWFRDDGDTDEIVTIANYPMHYVLDGLAVDGLMTSEQIMELKKYGETYFNDPRSGERTVLFMYEIEADDPEEEH